MTLCDTGPLYALVDRHETPYHGTCVSALSRVSQPLVTTWPCLAEAMYLACRSGGWVMQRLLWDYIIRDALTIHNLSTGEIQRMRALMEKYSDLPMDLADASLVAAAESLGETTVFTVDSDFHVYRLPDGTAFETVP